MSVQTFKMGILNMNQRPGYRRPHIFKKWLLAFIYLFI